MNLVIVLIRVNIFKCQQIHNSMQELLPLYILLIFHNFHNFHNCNKYLEEQ